MTDLPFADLDHWAWRWVFTPMARSNSTMHRLVEFSEWDEDNPQRIVGRSACGRGPLWAMPGLFSRMGRPRCRTCCRIVGVPQGVGAPWNQGIDG